MLTSRKFTKIFYSFLAFLLVFSTFTPFGVEAAGEVELNIDNTLFNETKIKDGSAILKITLINGKWSIGTSEKKQALINALVATKQPEEWKKVKEKLKPVNVVVDNVNANAITITIPQVSDISLSANEIISLKVPYQLLENDYNLPATSFTIKASSKVLVGGSSTPSISQMDIVNGGKTITLNLVNAKWDTEVTTNTVKREELLKGFELPKNMSGEVLRASADVKRTSDTVVTITLPAFSGFKVDESENELFFDSSSVNIDTAIKDAYPPFENTKKLVTTVQAVSNQSVTVSGTIISNKNEFDIVRGGETIILKLKNDVWTKDVSTLSTTLSTTLKASLNDELGNHTIERVSDTEVKITLGAVINYEIENDLSVELNIPEGVLTTSNSDGKVTFKIAAVKAELSGTALQSLDSTELNKGGKTIIITVNNANFNTTNPDFKKNLIESMSSNDNPELLSLLISGLTNKNNDKNITISKNKVTIKLPAISYSGGDGTFEIRVPYSLIENAPDTGTPDTETLTAGMFSIGQVAKAKLELATEELNVSDILDSNKTNTFSITLERATWDPTITTNTSKQSTLLKGFSTDDQTNEWAKITAAIKKNGTFTLDSSTKLSITIPTVSDYAIVRKQIVDIKIPKTVLVEYKYDIAVEDKITISVPQVTSQQSFGKLLSENFNEYIKTDFEKIRVIVPNKKIQTITSNTISISKSQTITTIEVVPFDNLLTKVVLTYKSLPASGEGEATENTLEATKLNGKFMFILNNLPKNTEMQFSSYGSGSEKIQADIFKKIGSGNKVFNEIPKKDLTGSYSLYTLLTDKNLMKDILKYYSADDLIIGK